MLKPGDRVRVLLPGTADVWTGTVVDHHDRDTWPTLPGYRDPYGIPAQRTKAPSLAAEYHPRRPGSPAGWVLVRYDVWPDDVWHEPSTVERIPG